MQPFLYHTSNLQLLISNSAVFDLASLRLVCWTAKRKAAASSSAGKYRCQAIGKVSLSPQEQLSNRTSESAPRFPSPFCDPLTHISTVLWALICILRQRWLCFFYLGQAPSFDRPCHVEEEEWQQQVQHIQLRAGQPRAQSASNYSSKEEQHKHIQSLLHMVG